jgi:hypothetical protein
MRMSLRILEIFSFQWCDWNCIPKTVIIPAHGSRYVVITAGPVEAWVDAVNGKERKMMLIL